MKHMVKIKHLDYLLSCNLYPLLSGFTLFMWFVLCGTLIPPYNTQSGQPVPSFIVSMETAALITLLHLNYRMLRFMYSDVDWVRLEKVSNLVMWPLSLLFPIGLVTISFGLEVGQWSYSVALVCHVVSNLVIHWVADRNRASSKPIETD